MPSFSRHLKQYAALLRHLQSWQVVYVSTFERKFEAAKATFFKLFPEGIGEGQCTTLDSPSAAHVMAYCRTESVETRIK